MKLRRITAVFLALIMLTALIPEALAARDTEQCNHNWKLVRNSATCTSAGYKVYRCTKCGDTKEERAKALGHNFGDWFIVQEATVEEYGIRGQICKRCGWQRNAKYYIAIGEVKLDYHEPKPYGDAGATYDMTATCSFALPPDDTRNGAEPQMSVRLVKDGTETIESVAESNMEIRRAGGFNQSWCFNSQGLGVYVAEVTLSFRDQTVSKTSNQIAIMEHKQKEPVMITFDGPVPPAEDEYAPDARISLELDAHATIKKIHAGDVIELWANVTNEGDVPLVFQDSDGFDEVTDLVFPESLLPGETKKAYGYYTVNEWDVLFGHYYNPEDGSLTDGELDTCTLVLEGTVTYIYFGPDQANEPHVWEAQDTDIALLPLSSLRNMLEDLTLTSEYDKREYKVGETVDIKYTLTNTGPATLQKVDEDDRSTGRQLPGTLTSGQSYTWTEQHTFEETDLEYGISEGDAEEPDSRPAAVMGMSALYIDPDRPDDDNWAYAECFDIIWMEEPYNVSTDIEITCDYDGSYCYLGDEVTVNYTIANTGELPLVRIDDTFQGEPKAELAPGESFTWAETYEITKQMINEGTYYNPETDEYSDIETEGSILVGVFGGTADYYAPDIKEGLNTAYGEYTLRLNLAPTKALPAQAPEGERIAAAKIILVQVVPKNYKEEGYNEGESIWIQSLAKNTGNVSLEMMLYADGQPSVSGHHPGAYEPGEYFPGNPEDNWYALFKHVVHDSGDGYDYFTVSLSAFYVTYPEDASFAYGLAGDAYTIKLPIKSKNKPAETEQSEQPAPAGNPAIAAIASVRPDHISLNYVEGSTIVLCIDAKNTGDVDLHDVTVSGDGKETIIGAEVLNPDQYAGESILDHKVTNSGDGYDHIAVKATGYSTEGKTPDTLVSDDFILDLLIAEAGIKVYGGVLNSEKKPIYDEGDTIRLIHYAVVTKDLDLYNVKLYVNDELRETADAALSPGSRIDNKNDEQFVLHDSGDGNAYIVIKADGYWKESLDPESYVSDSVTLKFPMNKNQPDSVPDSDPDPDPKPDPDPTVPDPVENPEDVLGLDVDVTFVDAPDNGSFYVENEQFTIKVSWKNTSGKTLYHVDVHDAIADGISEVPDGLVLKDATLAPDEGSEYSFVYTVDVIDVGSESILDCAMITAEDENGVMYSNVDFEEALTGEKDSRKMGSLKVTKEITSKPADGPFYKLNEEIKYLITYENTGKVTLYNIFLQDCLNDLLVYSGFPVIAELKPGEKQSFKFSHIVDAADVGRKVVDNYAIATYNTANMENIPAISEKVSARTGEGTPEPPERHISTGDSCVLTLTGLGEGTAEYELAFCPKHAATQAKTYANRLKDSDDPETAATAWKQIRNSWMKDLDDMYQELLDSVADGETRAAIMSERVWFYAWVNAREAVLNAEYPDEPQRAQQEAAELVMRQTTALCYAAHNAPKTPRPDSRVGNTYKNLIADASLKQCVRTAEKNEDNGTLILTSTLCGEHRTNDIVLDTLLKAAKNSAVRTLVFSAAQNLYHGALKTGTSRCSRTANANSRLLIAHCSEILEELMKAHEAMLNWLYPENPETVAELMAQAWREALAIGCADEPAALDPLIGTWTFAEMKVGDTSVPITAETAYSFTLNADGTAVVAGAQGSQLTQQAGSWTADDATVTVTADGQTIVYTLTDGVLQTDMAFAVGVFKKQ